MASICKIQNNNEGEQRWQLVNAGFDLIVTATEDGLMIGDAVIVWADVDDAKLSALKFDVAKYLRECK